MAVPEQIVVTLRAAGTAAFDSAMGSSAGSIAKVETTARKADTSVGKAGDTAQKSSGKWKKMAVGIGAVAGATAGIYAAKRGLEASLKTTEDATKGTMKLMRTTGMDAKAASGWAEITKVRGTNASQLQRGLVKLSQSMTMAAHGSAKMRAPFRSLGVSMKDVQAGDTQAVLFQMADGFEKMKNPAKKAALAQKFLGRQGQELLPVFASGSGAIKEQLALANKYGTTLGDKPIESMKELVAKEREHKMAMDGVKMAFGQALLPVLLQASQAFAKLVDWMQPFLRDQQLVKTVLIAVAAAFVGVKIAMVGMMLAASPLLLIPIAIAAIGAALVYAYMKCEWFRNAVNNVWTFIKEHWRLLAPILLGPFGLVLPLIIDHFGAIKRVAMTVFSAVKAAIQWALPGLLAIARAVAKIATAFYDANVKAGKFIAKAANLAKGVAEQFVKVGKAIVEGIVAGIKAAPNAILDTIESLPGVKIAGGALKLAKGAISAVPHALGGVTRPGEISLVGERGPELAAYPGGTRIMPLPLPSLGAPAALGGAAQTTAHFYLDRRLIATAVAQDTADRRARR